MFDRVKRWMTGGGGAGRGDGIGPLGRSGLGFWGASAFTPGLEAGARQGRMGFFQPTTAHVNTLMMNAGPTIQARARWLMRNNCYARAAVRSWASATVGAGIKPVSQIEEEEIKKRLHEAWLEWTDECDVNGTAGTDFYGLLRRVAQEVFIAGECFIRFRPTYPGDGYAVPLQLQLLPSEQLPTSDRVDYVPEGLENAGGRIRMGIEFDRNMPERRVAYWFSHSDPTDATVPFLDLIRQYELVRVPASEVLHVFDPVEAGQLRGLTSYAPAMVKLFQLDSWDDNELERQRYQSVYAATIESPEDRDQETGLLLSRRRADDPATIVPASLMELYGGEKLNLVAPPGVSGTYEPFQYRIILALSAALGIPYAELSADLNRTTYASSRAGLLAFRSAVEAFQHSIMIYQMLRPVWIRWMDTATLAGALPWSAAAYAANPRRYRRMLGITPRAAWVDPLKDVQAIKLMLDAQLISPQEAVAANGYDWETIIDQIADAIAYRAMRGIPEPVPGWGSRAGQQTTPSVSTGETPPPSETEAAA